MTSADNTAYAPASSTGDVFNTNFATEIAIGQSGTVLGSGDHMSMVNNSQSAVVVDGQHDTFQANGDQGILTGSGSSFGSVVGNTSVDMDSSSESTVDTKGQVVFVADNETGETIDANGAKVYEGDHDTVDVVGSGDSVYGNSTDDNTGDAENGGDDGGYGGYGGSGGYGDGYGGYDFAKGAAAVTGKGTNIGQIAQFDRSVGATKAATQADAARAQALLAANSTSVAGAATTAVMSGASWQVATQVDGSRIVTWSFASGAAGTNDPFSSYIGDQYKATIEQAFQSWSNATGLTFEEVSDASTPDIRIGFGDFDTASTGILGYTNAAGEGGSAFAPGMVIRLEDPNETAFATGSNGQATYTGTSATLSQVALHEIGRALGFADNADPNSIMFASASSSNQTLDATDLTGAQQLYGANALAPTTLASLAASAAQTAPAGASASPPTSVSADVTGVNQLVQALATFSPQQSTTAFASTVAQNAALAQTLAAPLQH